MIPKITRNDDVLKGIFFINTSFFLFSTVSAIVKWTSSTFDILQIVFLRNALALLPAMFFVWYSGGLVHLSTKRMWGHFLRSFCGLMAMVTSFASFKFLPLPEAFTLSFTAPFFIIILSVILLKEQVHLYRWTAILFGFLGVVIMAGPNGYFRNVGTVFALISVLFYGFGMLQIRELSKTEHPVTIMFYFTLFSTIVTAIPMPFFWKSPENVDWVLFLLLGFLGGFGQFMLSKAYSFAPPSALAHYQYVVMIWGVFYGWVIWGDLMSWTGLLGAFMIIGSGLYIVHRERLERQTTS